MQRIVVNRLKDCCHLSIENGIQLVLDRPRRKTYRVNKSSGYYTSESLYAPLLRRRLAEKNGLLEPIDENDIQEKQNKTRVGLTECARQIWSVDDVVECVHDDDNVTEDGQAIEKLYDQVYEPSFGPLSALLCGQIDVTSNELWVNDSLLPELAAEEARKKNKRSSLEGLPQHRPEALFSDRQVLEMVQMHCKSHRYADALLVIEEFYLQNAKVSPLLYACKRDVLEAASCETFLVLWRSRAGKDVDMLLRCGMTSRAVAAASTSTDISDNDNRNNNNNNNNNNNDADKQYDPLENLYHLKAIDGLPLERDHVLECLKGIWAAAADHHSEAELYLIEALRQNPELAVAFKVLGDCYLAIHEPAMAWHCWQRAQQLIGSDHPIFANVHHIERSVESQHANLFQSEYN